MWTSVKKPSDGDPMAIGVLVPTDGARAALFLSGRLNFTGESGVEASYHCRLLVSELLVQVVVSSAGSELVPMIQTRAAELSPDRQEITGKIEHHMGGVFCLISTSGSDFLTGRLCFPTGRILERASLQFLVSVKSRTTTPWSNWQLSSCNSQSNGLQQ
jgi:hypothetical protein